MDRPISIAGRTAGVAHTQEAFRLSEGRGITHGDLRAARAAGLLHRLRGRCVAVRVADDLIASIVLVLLDGVARRLLILSPGTQGEDLRDQLRLADASVLVVDVSLDSDPTDGLTTVAVRTIAELLSEQPGPVMGSEEQDTEWLIATSGTTGRPKVVVHSLRSLTRSIRPDGKSRGEVVWGLAYGVTRFAGLQVLLQSLLSGSTLVVPPLGSDLASRIEIFARLGCNALSATPSLWRTILMTPVAASLDLQQVTLGGEIADDAILGALARRWPAARVTHIFASTEAGVGFSVQDGRAGFPAAWLDDPPKGLELEVSQGGTLRLRPVSADQHLLDGPPLFDARGFIDTGDLVRREGDRFIFLGRENGAINVGGNKVQPEEVELTLLQCPGVWQAAVHGRQNPITGMVVEAVVVQDPELPTDLGRRTAISAFCRERLPTYAVPTIIRFVDQIALNEAGKASRVGGDA